MGRRERRCRASVFFLSLAGVEHERARVGVVRCSMSRAHLPVDPSHTSEAARLLIALREIGRSDKFLFGHQNTGFSSQHAQSVRVDSDLVKAVGSYPAVVGFNLAQIHNQALRAALHEAQERGAVLTCSWEAPNPSTGGGPHDTSNHPVRQVLAGGPTAVRFEKMLDEISAFLKSLSGPVLFRPFHENTGTTYWWGASACSTEEFVALWRLTQTGLWKRDVHNLLYVYSPAKPDRDYNAAFKSRFPGADRIDVMAFDYYGTDDISRGLLSCCSLTAKFALTIDKPVAIAEFGMQGGFGAKGPNYRINPQWFVTSFLKPVLSDPACRAIAYALTWANAGEDKYYIPLPGQSTHPGLVELQRSGSAIFAGERLVQLGVSRDWLYATPAPKSKSTAPPAPRPVSHTALPPSLRLPILPPCPRIANTQMLSRSPAADSAPSSPALRLEPRAPALPRSAPVPPITSPPPSSISVTNPPNHPPMASSAANPTSPDTENLFAANRLQPPEESLPSPTSFPESQLEWSSWHLNFFPLTWSPAVIAGSLIVGSVLFSFAVLCTRKMSKPSFERHQRRSWLKQSSGRQAGYTIVDVQRTRTRSSRTRGRPPRGAGGFPR